MNLEPLRLKPLKTLAFYRFKIGSRFKIDPKRFKIIYKKGLIECQKNTQMIEKYIDETIQRYTSMSTSDTYEIKTDSDKE